MMQGWGLEGWGLGLADVKRGQLMSLCVYVFSVVCCCLLLVVGMCGRPSLLSCVTGVQGLLHKGQGHGRQEFRKALSGLQAH